MSLQRFVPSLVWYARSRAFMIKKIKFLHRFVRFLVWYARSRAFTIGFHFLTNCMLEYLPSSLLAISWRWQNNRYRTSASFVPDSLGKGKDCAYLDWSTCNSQPFLRHAAYRARERQLNNDSLDSQSPDDLRLFCSLVPTRSLPNKRCTSEQKSNFLSKASDLNIFCSLSSAPQPSRQVKHW